MGAAAWPAYSDEERSVQDLTYHEAIASAPEPHEVLLGPVPCSRCGAWVEWAGLEWLALGTTERHDCWPYLRAQPGIRRVEPRGMLDQAHRLEVAVPARMAGSELAVLLAVAVLLVVAMVAAAWPQP